MHRSSVRRNALLGFLAAVVSVTIAQTQKPKINAGENVLVKVNKPAAVPEPYRLGLTLISGREASSSLAFLSSDLLEGRETGSRGYRLAADYASSLFALWGLEPGGDAGGGGGRSYLQEVVMKEYTGLDCTAEWSADGNTIGGGRTFREGVDLENYYKNRVPEVISGPVVFAGYGLADGSRSYDDFAGIDLKGKIAIILDEAPGAGGTKPRPVVWFEALRKANAMTVKGVKAVLVVRNSIDDGDVYAEMEPPATDDARPIIAEANRLVTLPGTKRGGGAIYISREMADCILAFSGRTIDSLKAEIESRGKPASFEIPGGKLTIRASAASEKLLRCHNVIGIIPGSDPKLKSEAVVIGAHLDHLGKRGDYVFNGADDNASGVTGVLEIARAVAAMSHKPKRSIVFGLWTGEELGLLGSTAYLKHPAFTATRTAAYLNLDMIGRSADEESLKARLKRLKIPAADQKKIAADNFAMVAFPAGQGLGEVLTAADQAVGLDLWPQAEAAVKSSGTVSDYLPFAEAGVRYLYWAGMTHPDYHQTSDSIEKISPELLTKIIRLAYLTAMTLADRS